MNTESSQGAPQLGEGWRQTTAKHVVVHAQEGSSAAAVALKEATEADAAVEALASLLKRTPDADKMNLFLVDPVAGQPDESVGNSGVVRAVRSDAASTPVAVSITRAVVARWFGPSVATADPFVSGLGGLISATTGSGPSVEQADDWVRAQLMSGGNVSILGPSALPPGMGPIGTPPPPSADPVGMGAPAAVNIEGEDPGHQEAGAPPPPPLPGDPAATSFVSFLMETSGPDALTAFLQSYSADSKDQAVIAVYQQPLAALEQSWMGRLMGGHEGPSGMGSMKFLTPLLKPHLWRYLEVICYMAFSVSVTITLPLATGCVIDALGRASAPPGVGQETGGLCGLVAPTLTTGRVIAIAVVLLLLNLASGTVELRRAYVQGLMFTKIGNGLQERMFDHLQRLGHRFYSGARVGDLSSRLSDDLGGIVQSMTMVFGQGVFMAMTSVFAAGTAISRSPYVAGLVLLIIPVYLVAHKTLGKKIAKASYESFEIGGEVAAVAQENLSAHSVIKAYGLEERTLSTYRARLAASLKASLRMTVIGQLFEGSINFTTALAQLLVLAVGSILVINGTIDDPGTMVALLLLLPSVFVPIGLLADVGQQVQQAAGSIQRANEIFMEPLDIEDSPDAKELSPIQKEIRFENVTFGYEPGRPILTALDMTIPEGMNVAIVGPSGSGKSTILNLILRFYDTESGRVTIDGTDIRDVTLASLRGQIGLVFQDTFIFNSTVRDNIAIGRPGATDAEIEEAAHAARLDAFIESQPAGFDTVLGERGSRMSGGQRQRLAIARALLRDPKILMLDEATSALDARTEAEILDTLRQVVKGRTTISITHRLTLAAAADKVYVLDRGELVEEGHHDVLSTAGGLYQKLYEEQTAHIGVPKPRLELDAARLKKIPFFSEFDGDVLLRLAERLSSERFAEGDDIVRQGEAGEKLYILASGAADVLVDEGRGPRIVNRLKDGDYFGEYALLADEPRTATVRAAMPTEVYTLDKTEFVALLESDPRVREFVDRYLDQRRNAFAAAAAAAGAISDIAAG